MNWITAFTGFALLAALSGCATTGEQLTNSPTYSTVSTFLMFQDGRAEEAMTFYVNCFDDGHIEELTRYGPGVSGGHGPEGTLYMGVFYINGHRVMCSDSPIKHAFEFSPSTSFFIDCTSEEELDELTSNLAEGGTFFMPPDQYWFSQKFAWVQDRYGISWQINLPHETE